MTNRNERMNKLVEAGLNTGNYFTLHGANGEQKIRLVFGEDGSPSFEVVKDDPIYNQIIEDGYVRNTKLHRRFVMSQMFKMLNYESWDGREKGYTAALNNMSFAYTFKMMLEEVRVLGKLEERDTETFHERVRFFNKDVVIEVCEDYIVSLRTYLNSKPTKKCKGIPYITVNHKDVFVADIEKKLIKPLQHKINQIKRIETYTGVYSVLKRFIGNMITLPWNTKKSKAWVDAYKGAGAYYTCKNLIMFHDCKICEEDTVFNREDSLKYLNVKADMYRYEYWRLLALMKKLIADNQFDFYKRMEEIYK